MITISPKTLFRKHEVAALEFRNLVFKPEFQEVIALAVAEFSMSFRPNAEQLNAVNTFIMVFTNMGEDIKQRDWPKTERLLQPEEILAKAKSKEETK